jgi:hypothetical protein
VAALAVATLREIESLRAANLVHLDEAPWEEDVVVGASDLVYEGRAFVAPPNTPMPDMRASLELRHEWNRATVTELLRRESANRVRVVLRDGDGEEIAS